jgi:hypothetical protein
VALFLYDFDHYMRRWRANWVKNAEKPVLQTPEQSGVAPK